MSPKNDKTARLGPILPEGAPRVRLAVAADGTTTDCQTTGPVTLIGSRRDCDLFIRQSDISKVHCALVNTGTAIVVVDLCSRTGTFVGGESVTAATLHPGNDLRVGSVRIDVEFLESPESSPARASSMHDANTALNTPLTLVGADLQHELLALPAVIGRRHSSQVLLDTPDVSLAHTLLFTTEGCPAVFDLGSRSGTFLNGERVMLAWLNGGDRLCIGGEELIVAWDGPQYTAHPARAVAPIRSEAIEFAGGSSTSPRLGSLDDLGPMVEGLKAQINSSQSKYADRAAALEAREAELESRKAALEREQARLAREEQAFARQLAEFEEAASALRARENVLEKRRAALAEAESNVTKEQAESTGHEQADEGSEHRIEGLKDALKGVRQLFSAIEMLSDRSASRASRKSKSADAAEPSAGDGLPAPLVARPLFGALDGSSSKHWPPELQDRVRFLRSVTQMSEADAISKVLAEYQAQHGRRARCSES